MSFALHVGSAAVLMMFSLGVLQAQSTVLVGPGNPGSFSPILEVSYSDNGSPLTQTTPHTGPLMNRSTPVNLTRIILQGGKALDIFNFEAAQTSLGNFASAQPNGIGILESDGTQVPLNGGTAAFRTALDTMLQTPNLNSYLYYDGINPDPADGTPDFDVNFRFSFQPTDHILVQERFGNTFFELTALDINGNPIAGANVLKFGENGGAGYSVYDWNSGFASSTYQTSQAYAFTVTETSKFFEGSAAAEQPVFGFRIDNDGEADVKFFGASDDTFLNNTFNPAIPGSSPIPEPANSLLALLSLSLVGLQRRR